jgi:hypothetical protein
MRIRILALTAASLLTAFPSLVHADGAPPAAQTAAPVSESVTATTAAPYSPTWEIDGALFKSLSSQDSNQLGTARLMVRRFFTDTLAIGADVRYWPGGSYPLTGQDGSGTWAAGATGQLYLFKSGYIGAYVGSSLLWVPNYSQAVFTPEVGFKWFATQRVGIGISYWILTDLFSYTTSFEPASTGKSRQNLGLELSVNL